MIPILCGSQTGTCTHLARLLVNELDYSCLPLPINRFDFKCANKFPLIVFIVSTHGDGQCPFNMAGLWDLIIGEPLPVFRFKYAVLGVGSSSFERYNWCGKILYERLGEFGAEGILRTLADIKSCSGEYEGYNLFCKELKEKIAEMGIGEALSSKEFPPYCVLDPKLITARLVDRKLVTAPEYDQKVYELSFEIPDYDKYMPGDCLGVMPKNPPESTRQVPSWNEENVDLVAPPRQPFFHCLVSATENTIHKEKLLFLANNYDAYFEYVVRPKRSVLEILFDFGISPTIELLQHLEPIYPRYYSCARISGTYRVLLRDVEYFTSVKAPRKGLCCEYLKNALKVGDSITVEVSRSRLFLEDKNMLFFSTGTGITLPRSVLHHFCDRNIRIYQGFRRFGKDQLCSLDNCAVYPAASVDSKQYIMDVYRANPVTDIKNWLIFVSGNTRVNKEIRKLLREMHGEDIPFQSETW